jgi:predicted lipoprotein with Yx(FWY)xxD motif
MRSHCHAIHIATVFLPLLMACGAKAAESTASRSAPRNIWGVTEDMTVSGANRVYHQVGTGFDRDLSPPQLIPDSASPPRNASEGYPAGVLFKDSPLGLIYTDPSGRSLYVMKVNRYRLRGSPAKYCTGPCAELWTALAAPADAKPVGAWHVVDGVGGPQWAYGDYPVFTYTGDRRPGDLKGHEFEDTFMAINYIPPVPVVTAPSSVAPLLLQHRSYVLADSQKRPLYAYASSRGCKALCDRMTPFVAGMASHSVGHWTVDQGTERAQWKYKGKLVYVAKADAATGIMDPAALVRP